MLDVSLSVEATRVSSKPVKLLVELISQADKQVVTDVVYPLWSDKSVSLWVDATRASDRIISLNVERIAFTDRDIYLLVEKAVASDKDVSVLVEATRGEDKSVSLRIHEGPIIWINGVNYTKYCRRMTWSNEMNAIWNAELTLGGIDRSNSDVKYDKEVVIVERQIKRWIGLIRKIKYSTKKMVTIKCKDYLVKLNDRKYYNSSNNNYTRKWATTTSGDIVADLVDGQSLIQKGKIEDYGTSYNFHIENDTIFRGIKKNSDITGYEFYVSEYADGDE